MTFSQNRAQQLLVDYLKQTAENGREILEKAV